MLLPKLISMNSLNFDFMECSFSEKMMNCKDKKDGLSREGAGRVGIYKLTDLPNCYTLECNYTTAKRINQISEKINLKTNLPEAETDPVQDITSKMYQTDNKVPAYTPLVFEDIGRAFCVGTLDFVSCNPTESRVPSS